MEGTTRTAPLRAARAALFAALCTTLSSTSHVLLSRQPLPLATVALVGAAVFAAAYALAGRERGLWAIAALLVPLELAADTLFTTGQHACYGPAGGPVTGPLRSFGADLVCDGKVGSPLASATRAVDPGLPWLLLAAHVAVGLLASWWLRRGEAALYQLLRATASLAFRPLFLAAAVAVLGGRPPRRGVPSVRRAPRPAAPALPLLSHSVVRRGPPLPAAV